MAPLNLLEGQRSRQLRGEEGDEHDAGEQPGNGEQVRELVLRHPRRLAQNRLGSPYHRIEDARK